MSMASTILTSGSRLEQLTTVPDLRAYHLEQELVPVGRKVQAVAQQIPDGFRGRVFGVGAATVHVPGRRRRPPAPPPPKVHHRLVQVHAWPSNILGHLTQRFRILCRMLDATIQGPAS